MFEYLLVVATTLIYFRVFGRTEMKNQSTQTDPWVPLQVLDFMDVSESEMECTSVQLVDWFVSTDSDTSEIELPPLTRSQATEFKESRPLKQ